MHRGQFPGSHGSLQEQVNFQMVCSIWDFWAHSSVTWALVFKLVIPQGLELGFFCRCPLDDPVYSPRWSHPQLKH